MTSLSNKIRSSKVFSFYYAVVSTEPLQGHLQNYNIRKRKLSRAHQILENWWQRSDRPDEGPHRETEKLQLHPHS